MRWFEGSITTAITTAKQRNVLFVVYVQGDDDASTRMDTVWEDQEISQLCEDSGMVAVKFNAKSEECKQFSQFYPVKSVPCVSFISGLTGEPLEGTEGYINSSEFKQRIQKVLEMTKQTSSTNPSNLAPTSTSRPATMASGSSISPQPSTVPQASSTEQASDTADSPGQKDLSKLEKAARLKQKMEEIHQRKETEKAEDLKRKEIERRKVGQSVQKSMQQRSEQEARRIAEELRKEKEEDRLAKERIRQQIARDRAEKQSRYESDKREREKSQAAAKEAGQSANEAPKRKINMGSKDTRTKNKMRKMSKRVPSKVKMRRYHCKQCPAWYLHRTSLWQHGRDAHLKKKILHCAHCSYVTGRAATLLRHVETEHSSSVDALAGPTVLTEGTDPGPQRRNHELSLALSPISLQPTSPDTTVSHTHPSEGMGSEILQLQENEPEGSPGPSTPASMPLQEEMRDTPCVQPEGSQPMETSLSRFRRRMKMATVREYKSIKTLVDGKVIATEEINRVYFKPVYVDENGCYMGDV